MRNPINQRKRLMEHLAATNGFIKGSITGVCGVCRRAHCICKRKSGTMAYRLTYKDGGQKTQIVYIPRNRLAEMKHLISNYAKIRAIIQKLIQTNIAIFKKG
ncbi:MAG: hypothetical protein IPN90_08860 [Elusimicrobia bacterium]|jgi:hypothetical protein|nr:hypothetical protein [Elusimicrobiota bacterium]MBK8575771.1 hypothetical protein [Elusimicrobiota bacterium]